MRRAGVLVAIAAGLAAIGGTGHVAHASARRAAPRYAARLLVYAQEWSLQPSRSSLPAGPVVVQLWNRGEDPHDLRVRRLGRHGRMTGPTQAVTETYPGAISTGHWRLSRGEYEIYCSMPGHMKRGMHARLRVT